MPTRLADHLSAARQRSFVGRAGEQLLFQSALSAEELPFHVLHVYGPGGIGKTTLLRKFASMCHRANARVIYVDGRDVERSPVGFGAGLKSAIDLDPEEDFVAALGSQSGRQVILIDTYERLASLDNWLRDVFLPQLPEDVLVVLAGRNPPASVWRMDPGWRALVRILPLRNLSPEESRSFLTLHDIPQRQHQTVLDFTHGHPLALSLVADVFNQRADVSFQPEAAPDVINELVRQFVQKVPGPAHRAALEACALVRLTTEPLLAEMLVLADDASADEWETGQAAHELFEWLRTLSFIETGPWGLFPHDLAREVLVADVRWRNPDWYTRLHERARGYYVGRLEHTHGQEQVLFDYIFLHRDNPIVRPFFEWQEGSGLLTDTLHEGDQPALLEMVERHEGDESAHLADYWLSRQPEGVVVFRDADQQPAGFLGRITLNEATSADFDADPGARSAWRYLQTHAPLRSGEQATLFRFWMAKDEYQAVSPVQSLIFVNMVLHYLTTPGLAFTLLPCAEPDFWAPVFAYADLERMPAADFEIAGRRYGVYGHDWRAVPPAAWLALLAERETAMTPDVTPPPPEERLLVLSEPEFAAAVRDALRDFTQPVRLNDNPLLRSRLVVQYADTDASAADRVRALQTLIQTAAESLQVSPRQMRLYQPLYHTYLKPERTQEAAAEKLDLPISTFRRHLKAGILEVTQLLWQWELGDVEK